MEFKTKSIHAGQGPEAQYGAVMTPIYQTSTFAFNSPEDPGEFDYSRSGNPTRKALEDCLAALENGTHGYVFATGMAATATCMMLYEAGDHIIVSHECYGGTYRLMKDVIENKNIDVDLVDLNDLDALEAAIRPETKLIWIESPTNPLMTIVDLEAISQIAKKHGVHTAVDNTFLTPYFMNPLDLGIDIVMHSMTKYLNGHSDVVMGGLVVKDAALAERIYFLQNALGTCAAPQDCFLVMRGIKTLALRMEEHQKNGLALAEFLEGHPKIEKVLHPGLDSHPQKALQEKQSRGNCGTFSFYVSNGVQGAHALLGNLKFFPQAVSLGGVESLIEHPWSMTHVAMPEEARIEMGIVQNLVRVSVGIEDITDLIADFEQALEHV